MFGRLGWPEILIILAIVLLLFGATRLPKLAGAMGKAIREFRKEAASAGEPSRNTQRRKVKAGPPSGTA